MQPESIVAAQLRALSSNGQYFEAQSFDTLTLLSDDILTAVGKALIVCVQPMYRLIDLRFDYNFESVIYSMLFTFWQACKKQVDRCDGVKCGGSSSCINGASKYLDWWGRQ